MIAVCVNHRIGHVYPGQPSGDYVNAGLFKHLSNSAVRWVLARFDNPGHRCPRLVVGPLDQEHLLIANHDGADGRQPHRCVSDVPTKLDDEFRNRHSQLFNRDPDQDTSYRPEEAELARHMRQANSGFRINRGRCGDWLTCRAEPASAPRREAMPALGQNARHPNSRTAPVSVPASSS